EVSKSVRWWWESSVESELAATSRLEPSLEIGLSVDVFGDTKLGEVGRIRIWWLVGRQGKLTLAKSLLVLFNGRHCSEDCLSRDGLALQAFGHFKGESNRVSHDGLLVTGE